MAFQASLRRTNPVHQNAQSTSPIYLSNAIFPCWMQIFGEKYLHSDPLFAMWREGAATFLHMPPDPIYFRGPTSHLGVGGKAKRTKASSKHDFHFMFEGRTTKMRKPKTQSTSPPIYFTTGITFFDRRDHAGTLTRRTKHTQTSELVYHTGSTVTRTP